MDTDRRIYRSLLIPFSSTPSPSERRYQNLGLQKTKGTLFILPPSDDVLRQAYKSPPRPRTLMSSGAVALCKHFQRIPDDPTRKRQSLSSSSSSASRARRQQNNVPADMTDVAPIKDDNNIDNENVVDSHPFWTEPKGSNADKNEIAQQILDDMLVECVGVWRNVLFLHQGVAVYEIRNSRGWGMRWTLEITEADVPPTDFFPGSSLASKQPDSESNTDDIGGNVAIATDPVHITADENDFLLSPAQGHGPGQTENLQVTGPNEKEWQIDRVIFRGFLEPIKDVAIV